MNWEIIVFLGYFIILLGVALVFYFNGSNKNSEDFFLGGRSMGPWVTALSAQASDMSAWLLMGLPGSILAFGFGQMWIGIGLALGTAANWILCAKRLRTFSKAADDAITVPQYLTNRFAVDSRSLQLVCALIFLFAYTIYVASALVAGTSVFTTLFPDVSPKLAMFVFLLIIVAYTFFGGFTAVCWTDFFQGMLMMLALMLVPIVVYFGHRELSGSHRADHRVRVHRRRVRRCYPVQLRRRPVQRQLAGYPQRSGLGSGLLRHAPHSGALHVHQEALHDPQVLHRSHCMGHHLPARRRADRLLWPHGHGRGAADGGQPEAGVHRHVPPLLPCRHLRTAAGGHHRRLHLHGRLPAAGGVQLLHRRPVQALLPQERHGEGDADGGSCSGAGAVRRSPIVIANSKGSGAQAIMDMVENAWGAFGASFGPTILLSLFWRRFNYKGAVAGVVSGFVVDLGWLLTGLTASTGVFEIVPGFCASFIVAFLVGQLYGSAQCPGSGDFR